MNFYVNVNASTQKFQQIALVINNFLIDLADGTHISYSAQTVPKVRLPSRSTRITVELQLPPLVVRVTGTCGCERTSEHINISALLFGRNPKI